MPFRKNFFGDHISQPGTGWDEIMDMLADKHGIAGAAPESAEIFTNDNDDGENLFGFGGTILVTGIDLDADEDEEEDPVTERIIDYDGFASIDDARMWLLGFGIKDYNIEEVG